MTAHRDRLSVLDNSFLGLEREGSHMHVGGLLLFGGEALECEELLEHIESRLHLVPRYRQKVVFPRLQAGRPMWVDDPCFNLDYHVRHTALPRPGSIDQLRRLTARVFSQRLDRTKPLWEMWLVEGLEDGRFAVISKAHHALIDGMSGVDLLTVLFDATPEPQPMPRPEREWVPERSPSQVELIAEGAADAALAPARIAGRALGALRSPERTVEGVRGIAETLVPPAVAPAPSTPLNTSIGPHRRVHWVRADLGAFKAVKNSLGGTVNDVVLAVVAGGLGRWLRERRGVRTQGLELRALVPVSVRAESEKYHLGNRVAAMRGPLPVHIEDPVARLRRVREAMTGLKESKQAVGAEVLTNLQEFAPPTLLAQAARINFSTRLFNLIVTNVPGPQFPVYLRGRELDELIPFAFLPRDHALAFAIMSYNGRLDFGLLGDYDAMPDIEAVGEALERSLEELLEAAGEEAPSGARARAASRQAVPTGAVD